MNEETVSENGALVKVESGQLIRPEDVIARCVEQAKPLAALVKSKNMSVRISGREFVKIEGWLVLASMNRAVPREISVVEKPDGSYVATMGLYRNDGSDELITVASAECGMDEPKWASAAAYARRSMAMTRAAGKACRLAYSHVVAMAGYEPTPFEEMDGVHVQPRTQTVDAVEVEDEDEDGPFSTTPPEPKKSSGPVIPFGKNKGKPLTELTAQSLNWYRDKMLENRETKGSLSRVDEMLLQDLEMELSRRKAQPSVSGTVPF